MNFFHRDPDMVFFMHYARWHTRSFYKFTADYISGRGPRLIDICCINEHISNFSCHRYAVKRYIGFSQKDAKQALTALEDYIAHLIPQINKQEQIALLYTDKALPKNSGMKPYLKYQALVAKKQRATDMLIELREIFNKASSPAELVEKETKSPEVKNLVSVQRLSQA